MHQIHLIEFLNIDLHPVEKPMLILVRGTHGSGKSTIPIQMINSDETAFEVGIYTLKTFKIIATIVPKHKFVIIGQYKILTGGADGIDSLDEIITFIELFLAKRWNILAEGVFVSSIEKKWVQFLGSVTKSHPIYKLINFSIVNNIYVCIDRVYNRHGKVPKYEHVEKLFNAVKRQIPAFLNAGITTFQVTNENIPIEKTLEWFFNLVTNHSTSYSDVPSENFDSTKKLSKDRKTNKLLKIKRLVNIESPEPLELYIPTKSEVTGYGWSKYYVEPKGVKANGKFMRLFWYWISERMKIWYKRTIQRLPEPWTSDIILRKHSFTNAIRDLDKATVIYIKEILSKIQESTPDKFTRFREIVLNTLIYRLFIKYETWKCIGFLYLKTFNEQWDLAKENLRARKLKGEPIFHSAYMINGLPNVNSNLKTKHDKLENAICMCELFYTKNLEISEFLLKNQMDACLEKLNELPNFNSFNSYEILCDLALAPRHFGVKLLPFTDDDYVNVGSGNRLGLDILFDDFGELSYFQLDIYLRATWKHYMKLYGFHDEFISQLPSWMNGDINLRVIEHSLCEFQKYISIYYGVGKTKRQFQNISKNNLDDLII